jgi:hypothetical protein
LSHRAAIVSPRNPSCCLSVNTRPQYSAHERVRTSPRVQASAMQRRHTPGKVRRQKRGAPRRDVG